MEEEQERVVSGEEKMEIEEVLVEREDFRVFIGELLPLIPGQQLQSVIDDEGSDYMRTSYLLPTGFFNFLLIW